MDLFKILSGEACLKRLEYKLPALGNIFTSIRGDVVGKIPDPKDSIECCSDSLGRVILYKLDMKCLRDITQIDQDPCLLFPIFDPEGTSEISRDIGKWRRWCDTADV